MPRRTRWGIQKPAPAALHAGDLEAASRPARAGRVEQLPAELAACRRGRLEQRVDAGATAEPLGRALGRRLGAAPNYLHLSGPPLDSRKHLQPRALLELPGVARALDLDVGGGGGDGTEVLGRELDAPRPEVLLQPVQLGGPRNRDDPRLPGEEPRERDL